MDLARGQFTLVDLSLGKCECPGAPHTKDWVKYRDRLEYGDWRKINAAQADEKQVVLFTRAVAEWNLVDLDGDLLPIEMASFDHLSTRQAAILIGTLDSASFVLSGVEVKAPKPETGTGPSQIPDSPIVDTSGSGHSEPEA